MVPIRTCLIATALFALTPNRSFARSPLTDSTDVKISSALEVENSLFVSPLDPIRERGRAACSARAEPPQPSKWASR